VRSPPLRGGAKPRVRWPCGGRPGVGARGGFLGGARSPRPHCKAGRKPTYSIPTGWVNDEPVARRRRGWGWRYAIIAGVRSPPLRGDGRSEARWPGGERSEITRRVVFSEGRGLRARVAGPYQRQGIAFSPGHNARGRMAYRANASVRRNAFLCGRAGPAPPRNQDPYKENQRLQRRRASVTRDADIGRVREPPPPPTWEGWTKNPLPNGDIPW